MADFALIRLQVQAAVPAVAEWDIRNSGNTGKSPREEKEKEKENKKEQQSKRKLAPP
jgi:hypothetical protein